MLHSCGEREFIHCYVHKTLILWWIGRSTHNTRIERLWLEGGRHFARGWRAFFTRLERLHFLDRNDPHHLWLLHQLFLDDIQDDCNKFCNHWNRHPLSGKGENMCPLVCSSFFLRPSLFTFNCFLQGSSTAWSDKIRSMIKQMQLTHPYCTAIMGQVGQAVQAQHLMKMNNPKGILQRSSQMRSHTTSGMKLQK